jgi:cytochrome c oxidase subunit 2
LPINKAVRVNLFSKDVIHGFFVPAFRIKEDVVPGKKNYCWFIPGELGDFDLLCSAYCGVDHSYMSAIIRIVPDIQFEKWMTALPVKSSAKSPGLTILEKNGCLACHSLDGSKLVGPSFKGLYGSTVGVVTTGKNRKVKADNLYIKTSIVDPDKDIVTGFQGGLMQPYKNVLTDKDIQQIIEYFKTLK